MTDLQRRIVDVLAAHGGALCTVVLRQRLRHRGSTSHLHRAVARLEQLGLVAITQPDASWTSGPVIELLQPLPQAVLTGNGTARASQVRPEAP